MAELQLPAELVALLAHWEQSTHSGQIQLHIKDGRVLSYSVLETYRTRPLKAG